MKTLNLFVIFEAQLSGYSFESLNLLSILSIVTAIFVIITKNPIISVLYLIGLFITIAIYLVLVGVSFLGLSYLLVYVGAVSILFLFILMLINVRISELVSDTKNSIPLVFIAAISFTIPVTNIIVNSEYLSNITKFLYSLFYIFFQNSTVFSLCSNSWEKTLVGFNHINSIGNIMYTSHNIWLILVSLILLLAMVGTIVITIKYKDNSKIIFDNTAKPYSYVNLPLQSNILKTMLTKAFWIKIFTLFILGTLSRFVISTYLNIDICTDIFNPISLWTYSFVYVLYYYSDVFFALYFETALDSCSDTHFTPSYKPNSHLAMVRPNEEVKPVEGGRDKYNSPPIKTEVGSPSAQPIDQSSIPVYGNPQHIKSEDHSIEESSMNNTQDIVSSIPAMQESTTVKPEDSSFSKEDSPVKSEKFSPIQENLPVKSESSLEGLGNTIVKQEVAQATDVLQTKSGVNLDNLARSRQGRPVYYPLRREDIILPKEPTAEEIKLKQELKVLKDKARDLEWCIDSHNSHIGINQDALADKHTNAYRKSQHAEELVNQLKNKEALIKELNDVSAEARSLLKSEKYSISYYLPTPENLKKIENMNKYHAQESPSKKIKLEDPSNKIKLEDHSNKIKLDDPAKKIKSEPKD